MEVISSLAIGYLFGSASPALFFSRRKNVNIREEGTKNPGASNTMLVMGKKYGAIVMILDIAKAFLASKIARWLFPKLYIAQLLAGLGAVIGHVFPVFHKFKGGKGLAAFGGMALAFKPWIFFALLTLGCILMLIVNASYAMPMSAAVLFPIIAVIQTQRMDVFLVCAAASAIVIVKHWSNIGKGRRGEDVNIRNLVKTTFGKKA